MAALQSSSQGGMLVKSEPGSPNGMDLDLMPHVLDRCGVCNQPCPQGAQGTATCLRCCSHVHGTCDIRAADTIKVRNQFVTRHTTAALLLSSTPYCSGTAVGALNRSSAVLWLQAHSARTHHACVPIHCMHLHCCCSLCCSQAHTAVSRRTHHNCTHPTVV
jgi:hypothetical protein